MPSNVSGSGKLRVVSLPVPAGVADAVSALHFYMGDSSLAGHHQVLPSGEVEMIVNLAEDKLCCFDPNTMQPRSLDGALIAGVHERCVVVDAGQLRKLLAVRFYPGGLWRLFGVPPVVCRDQHVELVQIFGKRSAELVDGLRNAASPRECLRVLERLWSTTLRRDPHPAVAWAVDQMTRFSASLRVNELADEAGLSRRRFGELFQREVGTSPKTFARIRRFQLSLRAMTEARPVSWGDLALRMGFADQAHFIREFRSFTGMPPGDYLRTAIR